jgi:hypothetical protein
MRVHPSRFRHFKYREKYRKKMATHYVNKHLWNSESKADEESVVASEIHNVEQFLVGDRPDPSSVNMSSTPRPSVTGRTSHVPLLRSITSVEEDEEKEREQGSPRTGDPDDSSSFDQEDLEREEESPGDSQVTSPVGSRKIHRKLTARLVWKSKRDAYNM